MFRRFQCIVALLGASWLAAGGHAQAPQPAARPALALTETERAWIAAHRTVRVSCDPQWPPFSFFDAQGKLAGVDAAFLARLAQLTGLEFKVQRSASWTEALEALRHGELDLLTGLTPLPDRQRDFFLTEPYLRFATAVIARDDAPFYATLGGLRNVRIALVADYATATWLKEENPSLEIEHVATMEEALREVSRGKAYATITSLPNASYIIRTAGLTNLKVVSVTDRWSDLCFATRRDWPELASILNQAVAAMSAAERQTIADPWVRVDVARVIQWSFVWKTGVIVLVAGTLILWLILRRNRRLARDLAERTRLQRAVEEAHARLSVINDEKSVLLNMVAHDLRSPLTAFLLGLDTLRWNEAFRENPPAQRTLDMLGEQVGQMRKLIDNLLDMQALEEGRRQLGREPVDLVRVVHEVIAGQRAAAARKQIAIEWAAAPAAVRALGDAAALRQVVENLLGNAVKYSRLGGRVRVDVQRAGVEVRCAVTDDGPGIAAAEQAKLFGKFATLGTRPTGGETSHGLGLFIVRHLTTAMAGRVWCESVAGRGATFVFAVPAAE